MLLGWIRNSVWCEDRSCRHDWWIREDRQQEEETISFYGWWFLVNGWPFKGLHCRQLAPSSAWVIGRPSLWVQSDPVMKTIYPVIVANSIHEYVATHCNVLAIVVEQHCNSHVATHCNMLSLTIVKELSMPRHIYSWEDIQTCRLSSGHS